MSTRTVTVSVPAATASIDTSHDERTADLTSATQLFSPGPTANVVSFTATTERRDRSGQRTPGGLGESLSYS